MSIHFGGRKIKTVYYGGQKIQEAYLGSTKIYSSALPPTLHRIYGLWQKSWSSNPDEIRYQPGNIVTQNGTHYVALQPAANQEPATNPEYWKPISQWENGNRYQRGDIAIHYGTPWLAQTHHTAGASTMPGADRNSWKLISRDGVGAERPVAWESARRYEPGSIVEYGSRYWIVNDLVASAFLPPGRSSKYVQLSKEFFS
ncbi:hypothetical protein QPX10_10355 [Corynebacterium pseudodiphtheriticum]|uniref:hypothetical protein n=1 Tax=Corynebacterium TaxID=1716 RepID=UPI0025425F68|nr:MULTISPECIES: hypothetical protein [Corynebacterium]MDK4244066.1 hypothetical protein [Corynebacterium pseudodiphtheriticum]MDK4258441.1 hypothetical protein [Corynebacterium propinquum]